MLALILCVWVSCLQLLRCSKSCLVPEGSEEGKDSLEVELQIVVNFHMGPLQEQQMFLTAGLSLQSHDADFLQTQCLTMLPRQALNS